MASIVPESQIREVEATKSCHGARHIIKYSGAIDLVLRVILFGTILAAVILIATSEQTVFLKTPFPPYGASVSAKFTDDPALIYAIVAFSVACLYSIVTSLLSTFVLLMKQAAPSTKLMFCIFVMDLLLLGIVAAAAGAAGDVGFIGLRGIKRARWQKLCNVFDTYCVHLGFSVFCACAAGVTLIFLVVLYIFKLSPKNNIG